MGPGEKTGVIGRPPTMQLRSRSLKRGAGIAGAIALALSFTAATVRAQAPGPPYPPLYPPPAGAYAPYPQQYPQPSYAPQPPYPQPSISQPPPASPPPTPRSSGTLLLAKGYSGAFGITAARVAVNQGSEWRTYSGGLGGAGAGTVALGPLSVYSRGSLYVGGGGGGLEGALALESYPGLGVFLGSAVQIFAGLGVAGRGVKNDEIDATMVTLPGAMLGVQFAVNGFGVGLGPTAGLVARTDYAPGDELQGRRFFRRTGMQLGCGGTAAVFTEWFAIHGSVVRLAIDESVTAGDAAACLHIQAFATCGFGQYWRARATDSRGVTQLVPTTHVGITIGIGGASVSAAAL